MSNEVTVSLLIENYNLGNYPNPFAYETTVVFDLPEDGEVILKVFDLSGREVGEIDRKDFYQGRNFVNWKTFDTQAGMYVLKMYYNGKQATKLITIMK
ncbi:MAG: T9SS type A sorting domain-containing protein [Marinilabiliales bacterium]|nr:T9SS type A sorting domain-containing protein [Marinilabiliales bacterium]